MRYRIPATVVIYLILTSYMLAAQPYEGRKGDVNDDGSINTTRTHVVSGAKMDTLNP